MVLGATMEMTQFFVGVDFGSSYSMVSTITLQNGPASFSLPLPFNFLDGSEDIYVNQVATALVMDSDGTAILQSDHSDPASRNWFKLALLHQDEQPRGELTSSIFEESSRAWAHMTVKDMTCIFLRALLRQPLKSLRRLVLLVDQAQIRFNISFTFPASWGHDDCKRMKEAVEAINIQALVPGSQISTSYLAEQEAAFLSLLGHPTVGKFQGGELIVVCDGGGWTLDTASYAMCPFVDGLPSVRECGKARSVAQGAFYLHAAIDRLLRDGIEAITGNRNWLDNAPERPYIAARLQEIVFRYTGNANANVRFRIQFDSRTRYILISRDRLEDLFKMQQEQITTCINAALQTATSAYERQYRVRAMSIYITLTGGLSCNPYIRAGVAARMKEQHGGSVNVILPVDDEGWFAVANGAAIHSLVDHIRNHNKANILVERTSPAHFFVKCRGASNITLAIEGQSIQTHHTTCQIPDVGLATEVILGRSSLVVHYATGNMERKYVAFAWASDTVLQNQKLSLKFCPDREFGYLTIELLVDGEARPDLVLTENHF
ncbi:hypothetical protein B0T25DRAFT_581773 [Lasiosphaeria hispida]|uniref:Uncharacterized protein n=1 Tax=Lasiosphaeria hispida TaxID=260671 RepID=A0AAJ0MBY9_9PEZI|nr:hypothetical protein B0T25DRAFT_581773 [Lasiosphaeria hispida]